MYTQAVRLLLSLVCPILFAARLRIQLAMKRLKNAHARHECFAVGNLHPDGVLEWTMRVLRMRSALPLAFCFLMLICNARVLLSQSTTTTVTISNTVETGGIDRPGINLGGLADYGSQQLLKSMNYVNGGYFPGTYAGTTYACSLAEATPRPRGTTASRMGRDLRRTSGQVRAL